MGRQVLDRNAQPAAARDWLSATILHTLSEAYDLSACTAIHPLMWRNCLG